MYNILTVVENRILLKEIVSTLKTCPEFRLHCALHSVTAFNRFIETQAEIVILDVSLMHNYKIILDQFSQMNWSYKVLVLYEEGYARPALPRATYLDKEAFTGELLKNFVYQALEDIQKPTPSQPTLIKNRIGEFQFASYPDIYSVLYAKRLDPSNTPYPADIIGAFQQFLERSGDYDLTVNSNQDIICMVRKSTMSAGFRLSQAGEFIYKNVGDNFAIFVVDSIPWSELEEYYRSLLDAVSYGFFCKGEIVLLKDWRLDTRGPSLRAHEEILRQVFRSLLQPDIRQLKCQIRELFLQELKSSRNFLNVAYLFWLLEGVSNYIEQILGSRLPTMKSSEFKSVEEAYNYWEQRLVTLQGLVERANLSPILTQSLLYILFHYNEETSLAQAADSLCINKNYINKIMGKYCETTYLELLSRYRLFISEFLLCNTDLKISEISKFIGCADTHYFSRFHKKKLGISPEALRKTKEKNCEESLEKPTKEP